MFNNLTYKTKFIAVIVGFILVVLACYKKTYKHMFAAKKELNTVEQKLVNTDDSYSIVSNLKYDITQLDNLIGGQTKNPQFVQQDILDFISKTNYKVDIVSIEDMHIYEGEEFNVFTNQIEVEGSYEALVKLLHQIETYFKNSRVTNTSFYSRKNYKTKRKQLFLKIILRNYEKAK